MKRLNLLGLWRRWRTRRRIKERVRQVCGAEHEARFQVGARPGLISYAPDKEMRWGGGGGFKSRDEALGTYLDLGEDVTP